MAKDVTRFTDLNFSPERNECGTILQDEVMSCGSGHDTPEWIKEKM